MLALKLMNVTMKNVAAASSRMVLACAGKARSAIFSYPSDSLTTSLREADVVLSRIRGRSVLVLLGTLWCLGSSLASAASLPNSFPSFFSTNAYLLASMEELDNKQKLGVGDKLTFRVVEDQEEPKSLVVSDSGAIEVPPYLGRISVSGKTCHELAYELKTLLEKDLYYKATVIIAVDTLNKSRGKVYIYGQVRTAGPQEIPMDEPFTVSKAIIKAGGFSNFANKKSVRLTRDRGLGQEPQVVIVDVAKILEKSKTDKDLIVNAGDIIFVPARLVNF